MFSSAVEAAAERVGAKIYVQTLFDDSEIFRDFP
jgi:hypothetical protein